MRQAGILAAPGIVALEQMVDRLAEDHANAQRLAEGLREIPGIQVQELSPASGGKQTNIVYFTLDESAPVNPEALVRDFREKHQIKIESGSNGEFRLVLHYWVTAADVETTLAAFKQSLE